MCSELKSIHVLVGLCHTQSPRLFPKDMTCQQSIILPPIFSSFLPPFGYTLDHQSGNIEDNLECKEKSMTAP